MRKSLFVKYFTVCTIIILSSLIFLGSVFGVLLSRHVRTERQDMLSKNVSKAAAFTVFNYEENSGKYIDQRIVRQFYLSMSETVSGVMFFADVDGNTLGADRTISFTTINQKLNTTVYFVMMIVMFGGMFFFSSRQAKKQSADDTEVRDEPFNPYKEAKRTGKSLEEVIAQHEKETARREAKAAKRAPKEPEPEPEDDWQEDWDVDGLYKVKRRRPISEGGGKYITGRKAIAEARKAEEERLARRRAARKKK